MSRETKEVPFPSNVTSTGRYANYYSVTSGEPVDWARPASDAAGTDRLIDQRPAHYQEGDEKDKRSQ